MTTMIRDGKGTGVLAEVDSKQRLRVYAVYETEASWINRIEEESYSGSWGSSGLTADTGENIVLYLKNTHPSKYLIITKVRHRCTGANGSLSIWLSPIGTPGGTLTELSPANRNAGSTNSAQCEYYSSSEVTGLTGGRRVGSIYGKDGEEFEEFIPYSDCILPPNTTLFLKADNATSTHYGGISFYFRDQI